MLIFNIIKYVNRTFVEQFCFIIVTKHSLFHLISMNQKNKKMNELIISVNDTLKRKHKSELKKKVDLFNKALEFYNKYKLPAERAEVHKNFVSQFLVEYSKKYGSTFPGHTTPLEMVKISNVDIESLEDLNNKYQNIKIPFDYENFCIREDHDYNVYLTNDIEIESYKLTEATCKALNVYAKHKGISYNKPLFNDLRRVLFKDIEVDREGLLKPSGNPMKYKKRNY